MHAWCREQTGLWAAHRIVWEAGLTLRARGARSRRRCNNLADNTLRIIVFLIFLARIHRSATSCHGERAVGQYKGSACRGLAAAHPLGGRERALYIIQLRPRAPRPKSRPRSALRTPLPDACSGLLWSLLLILRHLVLLLQRHLSFATNPLASLTLDILSPQQQPYGRSHVIQDDLTFPASFQPG